MDDHREPIRELRRLLELHTRWRLMMEAIEPYERRDWPAAIALAEAALARVPDDPLLLYNLACCESLEGRQEAALEHLRQAVAEDPSLVETARADSDFAALADDAAFRKLLR